MARWFVLGFTYDQVVGSWQDWRLARQCAGALASDPGARSEVLQAPGDGDHIIFWYVGESAAGLFDRGHVDWRQFLVGECAAPPERASPALHPA